MYTPSQSSDDTLKALIAFYQDERHWVQRTRVVLQTADEPDDLSMDTSPDSGVPMGDEISPRLVYSGQSDAALSPTPVFLGGVPVEEPPAEDEFVRRPGRTRLQIDDLLVQPRHADAQPQRPSPSEFKSRILNTFSDLMDARMESCQRLSRLVEMGKCRLF
ncbi:hypothetical protein EIP86_007758 [Pleurotus ostreatoroseus]|nr:hypothetical protein EIP86_007758 [Pleurotus ostreatoroseus]